MSPQASSLRRRIGGLLVAGRLPFDYKPDHQMEKGTESWNKAKDVFQHEARRTAKQQLLEMAKMLRHRADAMVMLSESLPDNLGPVADQLLWEMMNQPLFR